MEPETIEHTAEKIGDLLKNLSANKCEKCGYEWEARIEGEFGRSYFVDDDGFCPGCAKQVPD